MARPDPDDNRSLFHPLHFTMIFQVIGPKCTMWITCSSEDCLIGRKLCLHQHVSDLSFYIDDKMMSLIFWWIKFTHLGDLRLEFQNGKNIIRVHSPNVKEVTKHWECYQDEWSEEDSQRIKQNIKYRVQASHDDKLLFFLHFIYIKICSPYNNINTGP